MRQLSILLSLVFLCCTSHVFSLNVDISTYSFKADKSYIEVYVRVDGKTIQWTKKEGKLWTSVTTILTVKDSLGNIIAFDKFNIQSPLLDSIGDFMAMKRFYTAGNTIRLEVEVTDNNDELNVFKVEQEIKVFNTNTSFLSSILPLGEFRPDASSESMSKNGYYLEPLPYHYVGNDRKSLEFYIEINREKSKIEPLYLRYYLKPMDKSNGDGPGVKIKKMSLASTEPHILNIPLNTVVSGDYELVAELIDSSKQILHRRTSYVTINNVDADVAKLESYNNQVDNSFVQKLEDKEMEYILRAHVPIVGQQESSLLEYLIMNDNPKSRKHFIYKYWKKKSPTNPEIGYSSYMEVAKAVDKKFNSNVGRGFQTDRGHMFLKHGKPTNVITIDSEVDAPPYEIWYYNKTATTNQTNVRFLFYNPSLAHNDFQLLHSTCLGERYNPTWERQLYKSVPNEILGNTVDATQVQDNFNRNARRYFNDF